MSACSLTHYRGAPPTLIATGPEGINTFHSNLQAVNVSLCAEHRAHALLRLVRGPSRIPYSVNRSYVGPRLRAHRLGGGRAVGDVCARHDRWQRRWCLVNGLG